MKFKAILFDWDLTLADSLTANHHAFRAISKEVGAKPTEAEFRKFTGRNVTDNVDYFYKKYKYKKGKAKLFEIMRKGFMSKVHTVKFFDKNITNELKKKGHIICIITGNTESFISKAAKKNRIKYDLLAGDETAKGRKKIWAFGYAMKKFKLKKKDIIYVGDHVNDIKQAKKAGIKVIIVPSGVYKKSYLERFKPDYMCRRLKDVAKVVE